MSTQIKITIKHLKKTVQNAIMYNNKKPSKQKNKQTKTNETNDSGMKQCRLCHNIYIYISMLGIILRSHIMSIFFSY